MSEEKQYWRWVKPNYSDVTNMRLFEFEVVPKDEMDTYKGPIFLTTEAEMRQKMEDNIQKFIV